MSRDYLLYLEDISAACGKIIRYTRDLTQEQFTSDDKTYDAVLRNLEIIGEAAKHVPADVREKYTDVAWRKVAGLRDIVAHEYFGIDNEIVWDVIRNQVPRILEQIVKIVSEAGSQQGE